MKYLAYILVGLLLIGACSKDKSVPRPTPPTPNPGVLSKDTIPTQRDSIPPKTDSIPAGTDSITSPTDSIPSIQPETDTIPKENPLPEELPKTPEEKKFRWSRLVMPAGEVISRRYEAPDSVFYLNVINKDIFVKSRKPDVSLELGSVIYADPETPWRDTGRFVADTFTLVISGNVYRDEFILKDIILGSPKLKEIEETLVKTYHKNAIRDDVFMTGQMLLGGYSIYREFTDLRQIYTLRRYDYLDIDKTMWGKSYFEETQTVQGVLYEITIPAFSIYAEWQGDSREQANLSENEALIEIKHYGWQVALLVTSDKVSPNRLRIAMNRAIGWGLGSPDEEDKQILSEARIVYHDLLTDERIEGPNAIKYFNKDHIRKSLPKVIAYTAQAGFAPIDPLRVRPRE